MGEVNNDNYINLETAAEYLDMKPVTLRGWVNDPNNNIPAHKVGKLWKFKRSELDDWINSGKSAGNDEE